MPKSTLNDSQKNRIYELNTQDGFSQSKLAALYDTSQGTVSRAIKDKRHEAEIQHYSQMMTNAMAKGVEAAAREQQRSNQCVTAIDFNNN